MPTYEYVCTDCGDDLEVVQSIHAESLSICPSCGGRLRKVFGNVGVVFKGSGFYKTDSRAEAKRSQRGGAGVGDGSADRDRDRAGAQAGVGTDSGSADKASTTPAGDKSGKPGGAGGSGGNKGDGSGSGGSGGNKGDGSGSAGKDTAKSAHSRGDGVSKRGGDGVGKHAGKPDKHGGHSSKGHKK